MDAVWKVKVLSDVFLSKWPGKDGRYAGEEITIPAPPGGKEQRAVVYSHTRRDIEIDDEIFIWRGCHPYAYINWDDYSLVLI